MPQPAATMHSPLFGDGLTRGKLTALTFAGLMLVYGAYSRVVTPRVRPPNISDKPVALAPEGNASPKTNLEWAKKHLPHVDWAGNAKYQMRTDKNTFVYADEAEPVDGDRAVLFKPFAMIWNQKGIKDNVSPITVVCDSAYVQFANKFNASKPNPGRVIGGALQGEVTIKGPNDMHIVGRDFRFTEKSMSMWSDQPLRFEYGKHRGKAVGLQCELLGHPGGIKADPERFAVAGFRNIRLRRDVAMNFLFEGSKDKKLLGLDNVSKSKPNDPPGKKKPPVRVKVHSRGSFSFDLQTNVATFEDDVRVYRPTKPGKFDVLLCHVLTLVFEEGPLPGTKGKPPAKKSAAKTDRLKTIDAKLSFRRLRAEPKTPGGRVTLISEASDLRATMDDLIYSAETKLAELRDRNWVHVTQNTSETHAKLIKLLQDKKGSVRELICEGPGTIKHIDKKTRQVDMTATWKKLLRKFPDPDSDLDIIELREDAVLHQPKDDSTLRAEFLRVWVDRRKQKLATPRDSDGPRDRTRGKKLHRMLALRDVTMTSPQLSANTKRLEVWFEHSKKKSRLSLREKAQRPVAFTRGWLSHGQPSTAVAFASVPDDRAEKPKRDAGPLLLKRSKDDGPIEVHGDLIRARIFQGRNKAETQVREIWTIGNVRVRQTHKDGDDPLRLSGDRMQILAGETKDAHVLHVYGKPAKVQDRGMVMEGSNIHLDRGRNRAWIDGRGLLQLPIKRSLDGKRLTRPQILDVWWKKQMTFDGLVAKFRGGVRAVVESSRIRCEEMDVNLNERVSFTDKKRRGKQKPDVKTVVCNLGVQVESYVYESNKLVQIRKGRVKRFTVDQSTGDTHAVGPGWMTAWRRGASGGGRFGRLPGVRANRASEAAEKKSGWNYTRIDFAGSSTGNLKQRFNTFRKHVKVVYGPVDRPPHIIDLDTDDIPKGVGWMRSRELVVTQHPKTKDRPAFFTMTATGNAEVDGEGFHAMADTITFNEWQDLYTLRSVGKRNASIWHQSEIGGIQNRSIARRMRFIPSQNRVWVDEAKTLDGLR